MPHITDGSWKGVPRYNTTVLPVSANAGSGGGGCYDGKGKALWVQRDSATGKIMCYRTKADWVSLTEGKDSVEPIAIIHGGKWTAAACSVQRINGRPHAVLVGVQDINGGVAPVLGYMGVWRDTSRDGDGTGPWVQHGVIANDSLGMYGGMACLAGEIIIQNGVWAVTAMRANTPYNIFWNGVYTVAHSMDGGATWSVNVSDSGYVGAYMSGGTCTFAKWGDWWIVADNGNVHDIQTFSSQDLVNWVAGGDSWNGHTTYNVGVTPICSTPDHVWSNVPGGAGSSGDPTNQVQYVVGGDPFVSSTHNWVRDNSVPRSGYSLLFNVGPDSTPFWVTQNSGYVAAILGWVVGSVGRLPNVGSVE